MIGLQWGWTLAGGFAGLVIGLIFGMYRVLAAVRTDWAAAGFEPKGQVGVDVRVFTHSLFFGSIVVVCTLSLGLLAGRIGYRTL
jgi:hypothetical protein